MSLEEKIKKVNKMNNFNNYSNSEFKKLSDNKTGFFGRNKDVIKNVAIISLSAIGGYIGKTFSKPTFDLIETTIRKKNTFSFFDNLNFKTYFEGHGNKFADFISKIFKLNNGKNGK